MVDLIQASIKLLLSAFPAMADLILQVGLTINNSKSRRMD